ncbi:MAG: peptide deformylase, partial [Bacilli bacterium]|nr:peptide deformylase [Bacilli bacterium]
LSVDSEHPGYAHRYYKIKLKAFDALTNQEVVITARGFDAIVLQHEYDHLDGLFFYDRIDKNKPNVQLMNEELI